MARNHAKKPYWEMNLEELREATAEFDEEHVEDKARPLTPQERARWQRVQAGLLAERRQNRKEFVSLRLDKQLLARCTALAKKKRISRDALIARGIRTLLTAEGS